MDISERMKQIAPSMTLAIDAKAKKLEGRGPWISSTLGPENRTSTRPRSSATRPRKPSMRAIINTRPSPGTMELRKAIGQYLDREYKVKYEPADIVVSCGAKHSLYNIFMALVNPGDEVLDPLALLGELSGTDQAGGRGAGFCGLPGVGRVQANARGLEGQDHSQDQSLILNSPSNPTGAVVGRKAMEGIAELALKHKFWVVSDEIYAKLIYGEEHVCFPSLSKEVAAQTILVNGMSKAYAMTGWRLGYAAGPTNVMKAIADLQGQSTSNPTAIVQKAGVAALAMPDSEIQKMVAIFQKRRDMIVEV